MSVNPPSHLKLLQKQHVLEITFEGEPVYRLPCDYLRLHSPSAEMKHGDKTLTIGHELNIIGIDPVGNYGIKLIFNDGHKTGIYSWELLHQLAITLPQHS